MTKSSIQRVYGGLNNATSKKRKTTKGSSFKPARKSSRLEQERQRNFELFLPSHMSDANLSREFEIIQNQSTQISHPSVMQVDQAGLSKSQLNMRSSTSSPMFADPNPDINAENKSQAVLQMKLTSRQLEEIQSWVGKKKINLDEAVINRDLLEMHGPPDEVSQSYHGIVVQ